MRPPKIENTAELLYALREISDRFGVVLIEDGGQSVHIKFDRLSLVSETDEDQPADNIQEARVKRTSALTSESIYPSEKEYTDRELAIRYARALQTIRLVVKDKLDLIEQCIERKDLRTADYHLEALKRTVDLTVKTQLE